MKTPKNKKQIEAVAFNKAATKWYATLDVGSMYSITKGKLKKANSKYNDNDARYNLVLTEYSEVIKMEGENETEKENKYVKIKETTEKKLKYMDVIGVVISVGGLTSIYSWKCNTNFNKRKVTICDETGMIEVTLWDRQAELYNERSVTLGDILVLKNVTLAEYNGYSLSSPTQILINDKNVKSVQLQEWYQKKQYSLHKLPQFSNNIPIPTASLKNINEIKSKCK